MSPRGVTGLSTGLLDRQILLQTATKSQDADTNEEVLAWTSEIIWAQWLPADTREAWQAQQRIGSYIDGVFRIHDRDPRPTPDASQIVFDGRTYDVKPYVEIGRGAGLEIPVTAHGEVDA